MEHIRTEFQPNRMENKNFEKIILAPVLNFSKSLLIARLHPHPNVPAKFQRNRASGLGCGPIGQSGQARIQGVRR